MSIDHHLTFRTLFGTAKLASQRFYTYSCQRQKQKKSQTSFSPLAKQLPERTAAEFVYLQTEWAALMSYGLTAQLLGDVSPLEKRVSRATLSQHIHQVARRTDGELGEEQLCFIESRQAEWDQLLEPNGPLVVGIDGEYVHAREGENSKTASFEVIVGKSTTTEKQSKHRVYEVLTS